MTEEKAKRLIGRKVIGFKFKQGVDNVYYNPFMVEKVGNIGEVTDFLGNSFRVQFIDRFWEYPASLIEAHLVDEINEIQKNTDLFFEKYEFIKEIEQLKADKEELADLLKKHIKHRQGAYNFMSGYERELHDISKQTLEKHGK
jgi:hypothetical protein